MAPAAETAIAYIRQHLPPHITLLNSNSGQRIAAMGAAPSLPCCQIDKTSWLVANKLKCAGIQGKPCALHYSGAFNAMKVMQLQWPEMRVIVRVHMHALSS